MDRAVDAVNLGASSNGLSVMQLFLQASIIVKMVMIGLVLASIWVWAIIIDKYFILKRANRQAYEFESQFWSSSSLDDLYEQEGVRPTHPIAAVFGAGIGEWRRSARVPGISMCDPAVHERIRQAMHITINREIDRFGKWMIVLATIGSVAPFVGLFGTVWGIMHSFGAIATMQNTSLSVVAPGISEALFATALGLVAAVPAVVAYNVINGSINRFADRLDSFATEFGAILSRQSQERS